MPVLGSHLKTLEKYICVLSVSTHTRLCEQRIWFMYQGKELPRPPLRCFRRKELPFPRPQCFSRLHQGITASPAHSNQSSSVTIITHTFQTCNLYRQFPSAPRSFPVMDCLEHPISPLMQLPPAARRDATNPCADAARAGRHVRDGLWHVPDLGDAGACAAEPDPDAPYSGPGLRGATERGLQVAMDGKNTPERETIQ